MKKGLPVGCVWPRPLPHPTRRAFFISLLRYSLIGCRAATGDAVSAGVANWYKFSDHAGCSIELVRMRCAPPRLWWRWP